MSQCEPSVSPIDRFMPSGISAQILLPLRGGETPGTPSHLAAPAPWPQPTAGAPKIMAHCAWRDLGPDQSNSTFPQYMLRYQHFSFQLSNKTSKLTTPSKILLRQPIVGLCVDRLVRSKSAARTFGSQRTGRRPSRSGSSQRSSIEWDRVGTGDGSSQALVSSGWTWGVLGRGSIRSSTARPLSVTRHPPFTRATSRCKTSR